ncbi:MAG: CDC48 family AAA ATPase [Candidatus Aenigmarchaeota archaeon]|nr:CDC48 family AAA ATPase [Candidatus Aenigmarchaeota archaeon]
MKEENENKEIKLRVGELTERGDVGLGIVRMDAKNMKKIGIKEGDIVELIGNRSTGAIAVRAYPADIGLDIVRMDGLVRRNCGTSIGEYVTVRKAEVKDAESVTLAPARPGITIKVNGDVFQHGLLMRPLKTGDIIIPKPIVRRADRDDFFAEIFGMSMEELFFPSFGAEKFIVVSTTPKGIVRVTEDTQIEVLEQMTKPMEEKVPEVTYEDIGGLKEEIQKVREMVELPLKHPELFERLGIEPPKGVLLYGPPGTGKTLLAKAVANEAGASFFAINGPEIMSKWYGQSEENLRKVFENAEKNAPSIIFIDEIDAIAPKREEVVGEVERRVVSQLLTLMDGLKSRGKVIVIAATNRPNAVDPALRRGGRFDREIEIGVPDKEGRKEIFQIHTRGMPLDKSVDIDKLAERTYGYVGADIAAVCKEAAMHALRRVLPTLGEIKEDKPLPAELLKKLVVTQEDFEYALKFVEPSAMREVLIEKPNVRWDDIGDLENVKKELREAIEMPLKNPEAFQRMGIKPSRGILLFGPPGCGKTLVAKAVATESEANFILVSGPEIMSKWVGESEKKLREIFHKAKQVAPAIICFDEIDAIASVRGRSVNEVSERIVSQLLTLMSGVEELKDVFVIATTNRPDIIDPALLRPGRFDKQILIPVPEKEGRKEILKVHTRNMPLASDVSIEELAEKTEGFSGADIEALCREAALNALRRNINSKEVTKQDFEEALKVISPSVTREMNKLYERILKERKRSQAEEQKKEIVYVE